MSIFTEEGISYLDGGGLLGRLATVGRDGTPHITPVGFSRSGDTIHIGGYDMAKSKKFRDIADSGRAAFVVDDVLSKSPWRPHGIEVRGRAEAVDGERPFIRIHPERIVSWGLSKGKGRDARSVG
ncbi:MAG: PPOX class F420-dependent oxidoreductase [Rubrobacter sp.]|jgi:pyridoxamine 5'-phosphate oxidase family protein|nr:PPOX class F420-dependent oxidoreductase [Rubrobacter sp.]